MTIHVHHYLGPEARCDYHFWLLPPSTSYVHPLAHQEVARTRIHGASRGNDIQQVHVRIVDNLGRTASVCIRHEENALILRGNLAGPGERVARCCALPAASRWSRVVDRYVGIHLRADGRLALQGLRDCDWETEDGPSKELLLELPAFGPAQAQAQAQTPAQAQAQVQALAQALAQMQVPLPMQAQALGQAPGPAEDQHRDQEPPPYTGE